MNQTNNLIQWKNLTQEQKDDFDFENYKYECQPVGSKHFIGFLADCPDNVYRLVIEPDKWYAMERECDHDHNVSILKGSNISEVDHCYMIRPAKPKEIPTPEKTLEQKIQDKWPDKDVVMLKWSGDSLCIYDSHTLKPFPHITAQSMKGFAGYIYYKEGKKPELHRDESPAQNYRQPIAVLFKRSEV